MTIYIGNLSYDAEEEDLRTVFAEYGEVKRVTLPTDRETRSEEHTSELQSLTNLVCRLLLEKKKNNKIDITPGKLCHSPNYN